MLIYQPKKTGRYALARLFDSSCNARSRKWFEIAGVGRNVAPKPSLSVCRVRPGRVGVSLPSQPQRDSYPYRGDRSDRMRASVMPAPDRLRGSMTDGELSLVAGHSTKPPRIILWIALKGYDTNTTRPLSCHQQIPLVQESPNCTAKKENKR
jgi:hypothetical protein